ncbi:response regulator [Candidatus Saccharibacteria bacterium]|nr:response regulator [Candidatus Saccharibacteria bacterium]
MTKILLVEDDKSLREIYGVRLLAEGYDIISAGDGEEALALAIKDRPALIVSDVMMPKISGFDMLDILRSTTETRDIKVIMMTALSSEDQRRRGEDLGADRYLVKSQVGIEDVVRTVHEVLGDTPPAPSPAPAQAPAQAPQSVSVPPRTEAPTYQPAQTPQPAPAAAPLPVPNLGQTSPVAAPQDQNPLPQPTAPFSTPRPAGLGDRIIQPLEQTEDPFSVPISDQMAQELQQHQSIASEQSAPTQATPFQESQPQQNFAAPPPPAIPAPPMPAEPAAAPTIEQTTAQALGTDSLPPVAPPPPPSNLPPQTQLDAASADEASLAATLNFTPNTTEETVPPPPQLPELESEATPTPTPEPEAGSSEPEQQSPTVL